LLAWERALQELTGDEDYAMPFWDWRESGEKYEICSEDFLKISKVEKKNGDHRSRF